jgi:hypothetical protein
MEKQVICNKAKKFEACKSCVHSDLHFQFNLCTKEGDCDLFGDSKTLIKVKCVKHNRKES